MIFFSKARFITLGLAVLLCAGPSLCAAAGISRGNAQNHYPNMIRLDELLAMAESIARADSARGRNTSPDVPAYFEALVADGRLSIGLGIGTEDLGAVRLPAPHEQSPVLKKINLRGRPVQVEARFILSREDFKKALGDCEVIFVSSHSRFGAGPVFRNDGKAYPFLMQKTKGCEIIMPDEEICGYQGRIKRQFYSAHTGKSYTVFEPDGSDLDSARPLHGYQLLALSTCTSRKHFRDEIKSFRSAYPGAAIFTTQAACLDTGMNIFIRMLADIFQARQLNDITAAMNARYKEVAIRQAGRGQAAWKKTDGMYVLDLNTLP